MKLYGTNAYTPDPRAIKSGAAVVYSPTSYELKPRIIKD